MTDSTNAPADRRASRRRKIRALLAGGLVLGVGAAVTLAAWTDNEYATGTFTAGTFNLEGSTTSATSGYSDHNTAAAGANGPATLSFTTSSATMSPSSTVYSPFWVRLAANTNVTANLKLAGFTTTTGTGTSNAANLTYTVYALETAGGSCSATGVAGQTVLGSGTMNSTTITAAATPGPLLAIGSPTTNAGASLPLCFAVTASSSLTQGGATTTGTWQFTATSTS